MLYRECERTFLKTKIKVDYIFGCLLFIPFLFGPIILIHCNLIILTYCNLTLLFIPDVV